MKKRKHVRKLISLLLVMALMSTCLGVGSVSVSAEDTTPVVKRAVCIAGPEIYYDPWTPQGQAWFTNSINGMNAAFIGLGATSPANSPYTNLGSNVNDAIGQIQGAFNGSTDNDINYLFLCGHGTENANCLNVGGQLTYSQLRSILNPIKGHFIIFIWSCYSGQAINRGEQQNDQDIGIPDSEAYSQEILDNFFGRTRSGELAGSPKYTVFCSSESHQPSHGLYNVFTYTTYAWAKGLGYTMIDNNGHYGGGYYDQFYADINTVIPDEIGTGHGNGDGVVTAEELNQYAVDVLHNHFYYSYINPVYYSMCYFQTIGTIDYPLGDVNGTGNQAGNGEVTNQDVTRIQNFIAGNISLTSRQKKLANINASYDANGADTITMADVLLLRKLVLGYPAPAPVS